MHQGCYHSFLLLNFEWSIAWKIGTHQFQGEPNPTVTCPKSCINPSRTEHAPLVSIILHVASSLLLPLLLSFARFCRCR